MFVEKVPVTITAVNGPNRREYAGNGVSLDDTACTPDLKDRGKVDLPLILSVRGVNDVDALDVACQARRVNC